MLLEGQGGGAVKPLYIVELLRDGLDGSRRRRENVQLETKKPRRERMKTRRVVTAAMMAALMLTLLGLGTVSQAQDDGYWGKFKSMFVDWDDDAPAGSAKTEVAGVRGVSVEKELGDKGYDWKAVKHMEDLQITEAQMKAFLQEGQLGPFKSDAAKGGGNKGKKDKKGK
jgi:hypothetical protein